VGRLAGVLVAIVVLASACASDNGNTSGPAVTTAHAPPVRVVATTSVLADFTRQVGGDRVSVYTVLRPNVDGHDYEPTARDLHELRHADLVVRNGAGLEPWFDAARRASGTQAPILDTSRTLTLNDGDPHVWHDPQNAKRITADIVGVLETADPANTSQYETSRARYDAQLDGLDRAIAAAVATVPNKKLVTDHDAFGYFAARYGFDVVGSIIPSFDSSAELSGAGVNRIVDKIRAEDVRAVFAETALPGKTVRTIAREARVEVVEGEGALYGDGLGPAGSEGDTYVGMMRHNATRIVTALGGDAGALR
jgi:zinc/manganese transport system substrate-binding protein/manganese/iron transport system substrate-binding protein